MMASEHLLRACHVPGAVKTFTSTNTLIPSVVSMVGTIITQKQRNQGSESLKKLAHVAKKHRWEMVQKSCLSIIKVWRLHLSKCHFLCEAFPKSHPIPGVVACKGVGLKT